MTDRFLQCCKARSCRRSSPIAFSILHIAILFLAVLPAAGQTQPVQSLDNVLETRDFIILADVKHGVRDRISFFSSSDFFSAMTRSGIRHVAIEMPRVLGRQAMTIETADDIERFAQDVVGSECWHFIDPDHPDEESAETQYRVATALGRQVYLAKQLGIDIILCTGVSPNLPDVFWLRSGLNGSVTKSQRDAAIMRERLSHDDELAAYIEAAAVRAKGGGKLIVIPGYAHSLDKRSRALKA